MTHLFVPTADNPNHNPEQSQLPTHERPDPTVRRNLTYQGVGISADALWQQESQPGTSMIARSEIQACQLEFGSPEPRPLVSAVLGGLLMSPSVLVVGDVGDMIRTGDMRLEHGFDAVFLLFIGLGAWLAFRAVFVRRYYLLVVTERQKHRLVFNPEASPAAIERFIQTAKWRWNWAIDEE